jgi:hypothetical protein
MLHFVLIGMALAAGFVLFGLLLAGLAAVIAIFVRVLVFFADSLSNAPRALMSFATLSKEACGTNPSAPLEPAAHRIPLALVLFIILVALPLVALITHTR